MKRTGLRLLLRLTLVDKVITETRRAQRKTDIRNLRVPRASVVTMNDERQRFKTRSWYFSIFRSNAGREMPRISQACPLCPWV